MKLEAHDAANIVPAMTDAEFKELKADIQKHGQRDPIILFDGKILDGRNRYRACCELGIKPSTQKMDGHDIGGDPIAYVISTNIHRRHLTPSQRTMFSEKVEAMYAKEAKERQREAGRTKLPATLPEAKGEAREKTAKALGISPRVVQQGKAVIKHGCEELQQSVRDGKVSVAVAEKFAKAVTSPVAQAAILNGALLEDDPGAVLREHSVVKQAKPSEKIPAARITGAVAALDDLEERLERLGVLSTVRKHVDAIREAIEYVKQ